MPVRLALLCVRGAAISTRTSCYSTSSMTSLRSYKEAVGALNSLQTPFAVVQERRRRGIVPHETALPEMRNWLARCGHEVSDLDKLHIVHVAGTKGKGTTCAFVQAILTSCQKQRGFPQKIGMYTSPHLIAVRERIRINSEPISEEMFAKYFFEIWDALEASARRENLDPHLKPVYFRYLTLMSFHIFLREKVDTAIYEVGVGGAFDSTNIIEHPAVAGITTLGIDHVLTLGDTIEKISWHKAGILKKGSPAYTVKQIPAAAQVLVDQAADKQVDLRVVDIHQGLKEVQVVPDAEFQRRNASLALALAETILQGFGATAFEKDGSITAEVKAALEHTKWRGRCEIIPMGALTWYVDGAHTADSLNVAANWFATEAKKRDARRVLIFNQQSRPESVALLRRLQQNLQVELDVQFEHVIFCTNVTSLSASHRKDFDNKNADPHAIATLSVQVACAEAWRENDSYANTHTIATVKEAVDFVDDLASKNGNTENSKKTVQVFVTGSIHLVGAVLSVLEGDQTPSPSAGKADRTSLGS